MANGNNGNGAPKPVRCAIYTRKSTDEGLNQDFNSLDAQRDAGEAYIRSQAGEGWTLVPDQYDDGGYTGANVDRPALRRLLADIQAVKVDRDVVSSRKVKARLRGLLYRACHGSAMSPSYSSSKHRRYRYCLCIRVHESTAGLHHPGSASAPGEGGRV